METFQSFLTTKNTILRIRVPVPQSGKKRHIVNDKKLSFNDCKSLISTKRGLILVFLLKEIQMGKIIYREKYFSGIALVFDSFSI